MKELLFSKSLFYINKNSRATQTYFSFLT